MATHPTRKQSQAADRLASAILAIAEAIRLETTDQPDASVYADLCSRIARLSRAFTLDQVIARALERRGEALGLRSGTVELLTLVGPEVKPIAMLLLDDDGFRDQIALIEQELGDF